MSLIEQALSMTMSQHLTMTMQMQQAIQILQLSAQDLRAVIEKEYLENPVLEMDYPAGESYLQGRGAAADALQAGNVAALADYLDGGGKQPSYFADDTEKHFDAAAPLHMSLEEELLEQAKFAFHEEKERAMAVFLIGSLDNRGYLTLPLAEAARTLQTDLEEAESVLAVIHVQKSLLIIQLLHPDEQMLLLALGQLNHRLAHKLPVQM